MLMLILLQVTNLEVLTVVEGLDKTAKRVGVGRNGV